MEFSNHHCLNFLSIIIFIYVLKNLSSLDNDYAAPSLLIQQC